ncbi:hypothetical protein F5878DRAFT_723957 [Lentinula raphanica]|uniref:GRF-type domain-containing protein n=1 Tax=Lentinula raphanica TaxID=153919 RepID=A0AA38PCK0_9AGAR|nr:hypothetical protein F5878DRAFT_723957 [Lentinula raphanica]
MPVDKIIHVSPVDHSGIVRCYIHELEALRRTSQTAENTSREFYCCRKNPEDRCDFFFWVDQLTAGMPHQLPPMSQMTSSTPTRTSQAPRTPSKTRLDAIEEALAEKKMSDSRVNGNYQFSTPSASTRTIRVKTPGQLKRDEEIMRALSETTSQSTHRDNDTDANVFQSSQKPPSNYKLTPLSQESNDHEEDDSFAGIPLTPPSTQGNKRSRNEYIDEDAEFDYSNSPSKNKGKKKAIFTHDQITPTTSAKDVTDVAKTSASLKLTGIIESLEIFKGQWVTFERQVKAFKKGNEAKLEKIQSLETENQALRSENDKLREKIRQMEKR